MINIINLKVAEESGSALIASGSIKEDSDMHDQGFEGCHEVF